MLFRSEQNSQEIREKGLERFCDVFLLQASRDTTQTESGKIPV